MTALEHETPPAVFPTEYWHRLDDGRIQCNLCPRYCKLHRGQRGLCYVRGCEDDAIVLYSYGRSSGFCIDPIEKKPLNHFLPGSPVLSFGTAGCNLACRFCQNWDMSKSRDKDTLTDVALPESLADAAARLGCASVAFTYNDPTVFFEYAIDTALACRAQDIRTVAVSAGYICATPREKFFRQMDAANIDLKAFSEAFYWKICGGHLQPVLETLEYLARETKVWLEVTTLLIPGENDGDAEIQAMARWFRDHLGPDVPWHFSAFHPDWKMLNIPATPAKTLIRARRIAMENGLRYVYTGNVRDRIGASTYCPGCGTRVIERDGYRLGDWSLDDGGHCKVCGVAIAGVFAGPPGHWGSRRKLVRLSARQLR